MTTPQPNEQSLKLALARMLPEKILLKEYVCKCKYCSEFFPKGTIDFYWIEGESLIKETEWLHICHLIEVGMTKKEWELYNRLIDLTKQGITWPQRATAICECKGVKI